MKNRLINFWSYLKSFFKRRKINRINKSLEKAVKQQEADKMILRAEIMVFIRKKLRLKGKSKFIPKKIKNKTEIREMVYGQFGDRMTDLNLHLSNDLMFR